MMRRMTALLFALSLPALVAGCSGDKAPKTATATATAGETSKQAPSEKPAVKAPAAPAVAPIPKPAAPKVREKPSEEACKLACKKILGLAVEKVPEIRRRGAQSFMDAVVDEACPDKCMRSGTRASVACVNAAKTYEDAKACPGTP